MDYAERVTQDENGFLASSGYLLARVGAQSRRLWARMLTDHGLTPGHFGVLMSLDLLGTASQQELSRSVGLDPRNAVPVIDALQQRGLLERRPDPTDRRRYAVTLTPAGTQLMKKLRHDGEELEREMLGCLSAGERRTLQRLLTKLHGAMSDERG
jgi:DNA-binding MarR family transcriptional regulator